MNPNENPAISEEDAKKPLPQWGISGEHQNLILGLIIVLFAVGGLGLKEFLSDGDGSGSNPTEIVAEAAGGDGGDVDIDLPETDAGIGAAAVVATPTTIAATTVAPTTQAPVETTSAPTTAAPTTTEAVDLTSDVAAAVAPYSGVTGVAEGTKAVLTGYVDSDAQSTEAAEAAAAVPGIESVDNQLATVDGAATTALTDAGVADASVTVDNLEVTASGTITSEDQRQPALDAVSAVPGVSGVVDKLTVAESMTDSLNALVELAPIEFATSSDQILPESEATLAQAAEIINAAPDGGKVEVQGYTDVRGSQEANLQLSEQRAAAVVQALVDRGVPAERLSSKGFGGTTQFDEGTTPEAYAANRRVVFVPAEG